MAYKRTVALDFDAVIHEYTGWNNGQLNGPYPGALKAVLDLLAADCLVCVYSTRDKRVIEKWLRDNTFPLIAVSEGKPIAHAYLDDRAERFEGVWTPELMERLKTAKTYWENK